MSEAKFMRIIVFFDLPVTTAAKRKAANQFRQFLLKMDTKCSSFPYTAVLSKVEIRCKNTTIGYVQTYRKKGQSAVWK